ncbi:Di-copper centre-containing protein [Coprinopsis marcescibilis]|uniref:Di-copper centre-containing protein n=1 Tax=Coprinopsis marcescibilis TaxID=230819 RepID=A0A5C3KVE7_COPMA|nr:Di-copper centre-containing protein [Coprinopsis marcescibilis]
MQSSFRVLFSVVLAAFLVVLQTEASPTSSNSTLEARQGAGGCSHIRVRKEWRTLSALQKLDYIRAVKCLQTRRAKSRDHPSVVTLWDEFQYSHVVSAHEAHIGQFLPWHRNYLRIYEQTLRESCLYFGPLPYWNQAIDADNAAVPIINSPVFHPILGFGGDGAPGTYTLPTDPHPTDPVLSSRIIPELYKGCVVDGPFANTVLHVGPGYLSTNHCVARGINEDLRPFVTTAAVNVVLAQPTFETFRNELDGTTVFPLPPNSKPHDAGHALIGGHMTNFYTSPGEPLFYLHHGNVDRIWWLWQKADLANRLTDISGPVNVNDLTGPQVNLSTMLNYSSLTPSVPIGDMMNTEAAPLCYIYA